MKNNHWVCALAIAFVAASGAECRRGADLPGQQDERFAFVNAAGGLNMRSAPTVAAEKIMTIPAGSRVKILSLSERKEKVGKTEDFWAQMDFGGKKGWVFNGFLSRDAASFAPVKPGIAMEVRSQSM